MTTALQMGPLYRTAPDWDLTHGGTVAQLGGELGLDLDEDQRWSLDAIFAEDDETLPVCSSYCIVGPRQTIGKSATLEVAALADVFLFGVPLHVWTAHEFKTSRKAFEDMRSRILAHPDLATRADFRDSHGEEAIFLDTGERIEFHARSGGSGRGFTTSRLTLDEWMFGQPGDLGALVPTLATIPDAQIRYASSAGKPRSAALRGLRTRGRSGTDPSLAYIEHGAEVRPCGDGERCQHELDDPTCALNDEDLWRQANSGLRNGRVGIASMRKMRREMPAEEFAREFLSWWEDPPFEGGGAFDADRWSALRADKAPERGRRFGFGVAVAPDRSWSAIAVAWRRSDGLAQVQLVDEGYRPTATWVPDRVAELRRSWGRRKVLVNTAARGVLPDDVADEPPLGDQAEAHAALSDAVIAGTVRHGNQAALNTAMRLARWKKSGTRQVLNENGPGDISPAIAVALALKALESAVNPSSQIW